LFADDAASTDWNSLNKNYAEANLQLAQARLALALEDNKLVGGSVTQDTLDTLQASVKLAEQKLAQLGNANPANPFAPQVAVAESNLSGLEAQHKASLEANRLAAGSVSDLELRREAAEIAVAKARLAALQSLAQQPPEVRMQWQIDQLQDQIRALWARPLIED
jgi:hypothetical protein